MIRPSRTQDATVVAWRLRLFNAVLLTALSAALMSAPAVTPAQTPQQQQAQGREAQAKALIAKYTSSAGWEDSDALLKDPAVRAELQKVVGPQLPKLMQNISVHGPTAFDGSFKISGNAPHKGTEEEGVVCVNPHAPSLVEAAIFSRGKISVFAAADKYEYLSVCVKDWITQVNSGHRDRTTQPKNVSVQQAK
jgi:hypothetical protein